MKIEHKVVPVVETKVIDEAQGIVGAFVSVTGVVDSVKDRIIPGAYEKTLKARTPKSVWSHDWDTPVGKTLLAEELFPGDGRLPTKTRNGEDWPAMAGALYVETQFNLDTQRGREAFSDVKFYGDQQEWSIGYNVPPGASKLDGKTGVRELSYIDLYEYSPVLFGAMSLTATAGVKDAQEAWKTAVAAGTAHEGQVTEAERKEGQEATTGDDPDVPTPAPVAEGFTTLTEDTPITTPPDPQHVADPHPEGSGTNAGVGVEARPTVEGPAGSAEVTPAKSAEFVVGLSVAGLGMLDGVKAWALEEAGKDGADLGAVFMEAQDRTKAILEDRANYTVTAVDVVEGKAMVTLTGSYEERQQALRRQAATVTDGFDLDESDEWGYPRYYLGVEATFNNRVVYAAYDMAGEDGVRYFEASYTYDGQQAALKNPREVRVEAAVVAKGMSRLAVLQGAEATHRSALGAGDQFTVQKGTLRPEGGPVNSGVEAKDDEPEEGEDTMVTLSEADILMLERLKLDA